MVAGRLEGRTQKDDNNQDFTAFAYRYTSRG
jgi:hypothetical protein